MTEAQFSATVVRSWRAKGYLVQRIESGTTGRGIPDLFVGCKHGCTWVELKKVKWNPYDGMQVPWRPGQQAWMYSCWKMTGMLCWTLVRCPKCILAIPMNRVYKNNQVLLHEVQVYASIGNIDL